MEMISDQVDPERAAGATQGLTGVVVADDRPLIRAGLRTVLDGSDLDLVGDTELRHTLELVERRRPAVLVVAVRANDPDPFRVVAAAKALLDELRVVVIADGSSVIDLREAVIAGVDSFLLSDASPDEIRDAVAATATGERVISPQVAMQLAGSWRQEAAETSSSSLTARELEVLQLLAEGLTNQEIAKRLDLSARTVKTHVQNLLSKLDVPDRTGAVARGFRVGLIR